MHCTRVTKVDAGRTRSGPFCRKIHHVALLGQHVVGVDGKSTHGDLFQLSLASGMHARCPLHSSMYTDGPVHPLLRWSINLSSRPQFRWRKRRARIAVAFVTGESVTRVQVASRGTRIHGTVLSIIRRSIALSSRPWFRWRERRARLAVPILTGESASRAQAALRDLHAASVALIRTASAKPSRNSTIAATPR